MEGTFFKFFLILIFSSIFATNHDYYRWTSSVEKDAFLAAVCVAHCQEDKLCWEQCRHSSIAGAGRNSGADASPFVEDINGARFFGPANFNASLHCKDIDVIRIKHNPGVWVIEQTSLRNDSSNLEDNDADGKIIQVSNMSTISSFTNLTAGTSYRYKAHRVTSDGLISEPEVTPWFKTFDMNHRSEEVKNVVLASQQLDEMNPSRVQADIIFQPASDRSCHYEIVSFNVEQGLTIGNLDSLQDFRFTLHDLDYETNVSVFISSSNMGNLRNSNNVSLAFVTPSCLELYRNLTFCAPDRVRGFHATELYQNGTIFNISVVWDKPIFVPNTYTLYVQSVDYYGNKESSPGSTTIFPGNATEALLTIKLNDNDIEQRQRIISIIAESAGGTSPQAWIHVTLDDALSSNMSITAATVMMEMDLRSAGLIAVPSVTIIVIFLLGIVYVCRTRCNRNIKNNDCNDKSYSYCQNLNDAGKNKNRGSTFYVMAGKTGNLNFEKRVPLLAIKETIDKFEIHPSQLTIKDVLGSGASGIVRLGTLCDTKNQTIDVAIKMLRDNPNTDDLKNLQQEISIMKSAGHHPNIVSIIGCCTVNLTRPLLIVEYCSQGDLQTYLRTIWQETMSRVLERRALCKIANQGNTTPRMENIDNKVENLTYWIEAHQIAITNQLYDIQEDDKDQITAADLLSFARQVASGMEFLSSNRIIHRDLAARNVLLCPNKSIKISDFGLSRDIYQENVYKKQGNGRLPLKWMAIEALTHQIYTTQSDVWSFGILLWEIVTLGCNPYPETPTNMVLQLLKSGYRMEKPDNCGDELYSIMLSCWHSRPCRRPTFTQLKNQLDRLLQTTCHHEYLNLYDILRESTATTFEQHEVTR